MVIALMLFVLKVFVPHLLLNITNLFITFMHMTAYCQILVKCDAVPMNQSLGCSQLSGNAVWPCGS